MASEIKQSYLDKLVRKPTPKLVQQFLTDYKSSNTSELEEGELEEVGSSIFIIVDNRSSVKIKCEPILEKINRHVGHVFDKRKIREEPGRRIVGPERFTSSYLETTLGKRLKKPEVEPEPEPEQEVEPEVEPELGEIPEKLPVEPIYTADDEQIEIPEVEPIVRKPRKEKMPKINIIEPINPYPKITEETMINGRQVLPRLPKPEKIVLRTSNYYMMNRKLYMQKLSELFKDYNKEIAQEVNNASCERQGSEDFQLLIHQRIVRDYLNIYTPYRGLLLYHGLGSGKTCTSIAIAEGMKTHRQIYVMTPASLKTNFFSELKKCGDSMYKKKQYWEFVSIKGQPQNTQILSEALSLPTDFIVKNKGAWLMDITKPESNYAELSGDEQRMLDAQLNAMIRTKYVDLNYNGLNENRMDKLTKNGTVNPFDNSVVLIDEAHNLVSRISNKLTAKKSISYQLYHLLMDAQNVRIILLTGTPMINYPNELGILYNILRGKIRTWKFTITENQQLIKRDIVKMFADDGLNTYDYIDYASGKLEITRNPFGFVNQTVDPKRGRRTGGGGGAIDTTVVQIVPSSGGGVVKSPLHHKKSLRFKSPGANTKHTRKHGKKTQERIVLDELELTEKPNTSIEKIDRLIENVMKPSTPETMEIEIPEEKNAAIEAQIERELLEYSNNMGDPHKGGAIIGGDQIVNKNYNGVYLDEQGNISDATFLSEVKRILRKNNIKFNDVVEVKEYTALPDDYDSFLQMFVEDSTLTIQNVNLFKKRILGLTSYFRSAQEKLLPSFVTNEEGEIYNIVPIEMSEYQVKNYFRIRADEVTREKNMKIIQASSRELYNTASSYRIFSRSACNFIFPPDITRPLPDPAKPTTDLSEEELDNIADANIEDVYVNENAVAKEGNKEYSERIRMVLSQLAAPTEPTGKSPYLSREGLAKLSPKFLRMLENIETPENSGLHLVYSNFRSLEGIGIFKLVLEANGFAEFKLQRNGDVWEIKETDKDQRKPRFVLYTGTETNDEKEIIRNIYNSQWELVPASIVAKLREKSENNFNGEIVKIIMITASGAEGINLANTRFVHIMEQYWHMVRIDQVIGRARRICSHKNLPEELRTVKVFLYVSVFSEAQKVNRDYKELMLKDVSRQFKQPITTDESLYDIALLKNNINSQLLKSIKETAIDCRLYKKGNTNENLVCYGEGISYATQEFGIFPTIEEDRVVREDINVRKVDRQLTKFVEKGKAGNPDKVYARFDYGNDLYDWDIYESSKQEILRARLDPRTEKITYV